MAAALALAAAACVDVQVQLIGPQLPGRAPGCALEVFADGKPPYVSTDVASANVSCSGKRDRCIEALRKQACIVGADTIYALSDSVESGFTHITATFAIRVQ